MLPRWNVITKLDADNVERTKQSETSLSSGSKYTPAESRRYTHSYCSRVYAYVYGGAQLEIRMCGMRDLTAQVLRHELNFWESVVVQNCVVVSLSFSRFYLYRYSLFSSHSLL